MLRLPDHWVWDSWYAQDDNGRWHAFFLRASRALLDPHRRHRRASIGHAVSTDLRSWQLGADALVPADAPAWDDLATWTGCTVRGPDQRWYLFYTGVGRAEDGLVQRIGLAVSDDLVTWHRHGDAPLLEADPTWYELLDRDMWYEQAWRDPWVFPDPDGDGWHMLVTARANRGPADARGVVGHATSPDLVNWTVRPPLSTPAGFGHLEVPQVASSTDSRCCCSAPTPSPPAGKPSRGSGSPPGPPCAGPGTSPPPGRRPTAPVRAPPGPRRRRLVPHRLRRARRRRVRRGTQRSRSGPLRPHRRLVARQPAAVGR